MWSNKQVITPQQKHTLINDRYLALSEQIFLETQPSKPPVTPEEVPEEIVVYLQLFTCYPHIPQAYGMLDGTDAWLFDYGTVPTTNADGLLINSNHLIPHIANLWSGATALQQLNWLWQLAKLWKPLSSKNVAGTLLAPDLIRINGQVIQLLQLKNDGEEQASLRDLGSLWSRWAENAQGNIKDVVKQLASRMETGVVERASQVIAILDQAINHSRQAKQYSYQVYALSDSGPNRTNNEDAAYPALSENVSGSENALAIVCDGVGGHDGGEIASGETIKYLRSKISQITLEEHYSSRKILGKLARYINGANDIISKRNDSEQRQERQRMGTTLVMALSYAQEIFLGHVGDSRIYWITANSCHQMTIDDDLASREVRLGYALYRDSLQYPSAGALIQAIGMRDSAALHPNLQRYMIDDDCIFLLCTDGLSDFDRVEQQWRRSVLPVLEGKKDLVNAVKDLITLANEKNGHDNVTVALVHCKVKTASNGAKVAVSWSDVEFVLEESTLWSDANLTDGIWSDSTPADVSSPPTAIPEQQIGEALPAKKQPKWLKPLILLLLASTIIGLFAYFLLQDNIDNPNNNQIEDQDIQIN
ncbi:MAG: protein phosphatase 2C domain-containing protein [Cyanobacteria bacterium P01_E01_bin.35]